ncbi:MAG: tetratricopeptide repeat protein, partial [Pirellulaceae bacterium]|nr:tetratricopeptide repeat protein [Pirellulaceae bacterium]
MHTQATWGMPAGQVLRVVLCVVLCMTLNTELQAQANRNTRDQKSSGPAPGKAREVQKQQPADNTKSAPAAVNHYADAANFQNNGAFELAVEEWQKLLKEFPKDPLASKASHYLGVCFMQQAKPDYAAASAAFAKALTDAKLDIRDESLINLGWCQFMEARANEGDQARQKKQFQQARETLTDYVKNFPQGGSVDQALFFSGEIEYSLGNAQQAVNLYEQLIKAKPLAGSSWRADAQYALGVAYEQLKQDALARQTYETFLAEHKDSPLHGKVSLRLADVLLRSGAAAESEKLLRQAAEDIDNPLADSAMLRLGQSLAEQGKFNEASQAFEQMAAKFPKSDHAPTARLSAGQMFFRNGQYPEAAERFRAVLETKGNQGAEAAHLLAMTLQRTPQADEAVGILEGVLKWADKTPSALQLRMDLADALYGIPQRLEDARLAYEKIATDFPDDPLAPRAAYNAAFAALQTGKLEDARRWSETFLKKYPQDPLRTDVAYVASETMLQQGQHSAAIEAYTKLIASDAANPAQPIWNMRLAMAYYLSNNYADAIKLLESKQSVFAKPNEKAEALFIAGSCLLAMDKPAEAIEQLQASLKAASTWSRADEVMMQIVQAHQRQNDPASALKTLAEFPTRFPNSRLRFQARYRMAQLRAAQQDFAAAVADYQAIIDEPAAASMHDFAKYGIVLSLMKQDKYADALAALDPLTSQKLSESMTIETLLARSICLRKTGKIDESIAALDRFMDAGPTGIQLANGLYELGMAQVENKQFDKAITAFERVLKEVPDYPASDKILYELGWAWSDKKDNAKSSARFQELIDSYPKSELVPESIYQIAQQQFEARQYDKSAPLYASVLTKASDAALKEKALYKLGWSLFQQGKYVDAGQEFRQQTQQHPTGKFIIDAHFMASECLFKQDKFAEALSGYQEARQLLEQNPKADVTEQVRTLIYLHGAQCLREQKKWSDSENWLREIINRYPNSPYLSTVVFELATAK